MAQTIVSAALQTLTDANWRFYNVRRQVFYNWQNGTAPLVAFLSLLKENPTNDPRFDIYEKRYQEQRTTGAVITAGMLGTAASSGTVEVADQADFAADDTVYAKVASTSKFRVGHIIQITNLATGAAGATLINMQASVLQVTSSTLLKLRVLVAFDNYYANALNAACEVLVIGNAANEGQVGAALAAYQIPDVIYNYTQIFRTPFRITGTAGKTSVKYDDSGPYDDLLKDATYQHAIEMEKAFIFGPRTQSNSEDGTLYKRTTGGILWYLNQWEAGTTYGNTAATVDSDDNKRIITNTAGTMSLDLLDTYHERIFRGAVLNNSNEKLVLCGSGALKTVNKLCASGVEIQVNSPMKEKFGWDVRTMVTPYGSINFVTHPLFSQNANLRFSMLYLDPAALCYRYFPGRDSLLLKDQGPNNADYIEDEWFSEAGLQVTIPESCMLINNVRTPIV